ncbi:methyltransferase domain-containing protein [Candidatus Woesearchaeota archaeon]|nr:methyltransferase domain-containing protein [Candidatus Woesearchaeota archaeon]
MPRILIKPQTTRFVEHLNKEIVVSAEDLIYVTDESKDFGTRHGIIKKEELAKADGSVVVSNKGVEFVMITPSFIDQYERMKRLPQTIPLKDIGWILAKTGVGSESIIVDAGTGSGALALTLSRHVKKVVSYDIEDEHIAVAKENAKNLGIGNIEIKKGDVTTGISEHGVDLVTYDLPNPWEGLDSAHKTLRVGGFLVSYSPTIPQTMDFVNAVLKRPEFLALDVVEIIERPWEIAGRKVRPVSKEIVHSGFLTLVRKIR